MDRPGACYPRGLERRRGRRRQRGPLRNGGCPMRLLSIVAIALAGSMLLAPYVDAMQRIIRAGGLVLPSWSDVDARDGSPIPVGELGTGGLGTGLRVLWDDGTFRPIGFDTGNWDNALPGTTSSLCPTVPGGSANGGSNAYIGVEGKTTSVLAIATNAILNYDVSLHRRGANSNRTFVLGLISDGGVTEMARLTVGHDNIRRLTGSSATLVSGTYGFTARAITSVQSSGRLCIPVSSIWMTST